VLSAALDLYEDAALHKLSRVEARAFFSAQGSVLKVLQKGMGHGSHWGVIANPVKRKARA
jgi:hypothetical protein